MVKKEKLYKKAENSTKNYRFIDLIKLAEKVGYEFVRQNGSHIIMKHPKVLDPPHLNFQDKKGQAKSYQLKQLLTIIVDNKL